MLLSCKCGWLVVNFTKQLFLFMPLLGAFDLYEKVEFVAGFTGG
jgi:hypothetical protein